MRLLAVVAMLGCASGGGAPPPRAQPEHVRLWHPEHEAKVSPYLVMQWKGHGLPTRRYSPIVVTVDADPPAAIETLATFGAEHLRFVTIEPGAAGTVTARASASPTRTVFAMLPNEALRFVVALPIVTRLDGAGAWPGGPELPAEVQRRLDPALRSALDDVGDERRYSVGAIAKATGCIDAAKRAEARALGVLLGSVIADRSCSHTIFTFEIPLAKLVEFASLPWIVKIEGGGHYRPERDDS